MLLLSMYGLQIIGLQYIQLALHNLTVLINTAITVFNYSFSK